MEGVEIYEEEEDEGNGNESEEDGEGEDDNNPEEDEEEDVEEVPAPPKATKTFVSKQATKTQPTRTQPARTQSTKIQATKPKQSKPDDNADEIEDAYLPNYNAKHETVCLGYSIYNTVMQVCYYLVHCKYLIYSHNIAVVFHIEEQVGQ